MQRKTSQRDAIRRAIEEAGRPLTPQEILEAAREHVPGTGIATVYRAVKDLLDERWLQPVDLPGEPSRYEVANLPHHHHFHCRQCGRVFDIHHCIGDFKKMTPKGFVLESHELTLRGLCQACSSSAAAQAKPAKDHDGPGHACP